METKTCITCENEKHVSQFYRRKLTHTVGYFNECKACKKARGRRRFIANVSRHREMVGKRYRAFGRFDRYGLTKETFNELLRQQGGACALCGTEKPGGKGKWHVDHEGGTIRGRYKQCQADAVRGLLCHRCNVSLGHYEKLLSRVGRASITRYLG